MNLTIEKAKEIIGIKYPSRYWDGRTPGYVEVQHAHAKGFIEGWNQAIETILLEFENDPIKYSPTPNQYLKIKELKVNGEK